MSVSLLVITHNQLGQELIDTAASILDKQLPEVNFISISANLKPDDLGHYADQVKNMINQLDIEKGVLILTDICGATPYNLAKYFASDKNIKIVSGISLPMLLRVLNFPNQSLQALSLTAIKGACKGAIQD
jgi:PTS system ascorbate-specific IIA component